MTYDRIALASYPRSGNTWTRRILWECAGLKSGPVSQTPFDYDLAAGTALFEDADAPLRKTHELDAFAYPAAILIVRNPLDAIESYHAFNEEFGTPQDNWDCLVIRYAERWRDFHEHWLDSGLPMEIVRYRELVWEPTLTAARVLDFVGACGDSSRAAKCDFNRMRAEAASGHRFYRRGRVGYGLARFTLPQALAVLAICGGPMARLGLVRS